MPKRKPSDNTSAAATASQVEEDERQRQSQSQSQSPFHDDDGAEDGKENEQRLAYAFLRKRVKYVPERLIKKKWTRLSDAAQARVREILQAAERPVLSGSAREVMDKETAAIGFEAIDRHVELILEKRPSIAH